MKAWLGLVMVLALSACGGACDGVNTTSCARACSDTGQAMKSYSSDKGCECTAKIGGND